MNENLNVSTLVQLLRHRARYQPDQCAYTLLAGHDSAETSLTYGELDRQARAVSTRLQKLDATGERVLLLYPTSLEYISAFFGCLYAGAVPVPAYPPRRNRPDPRIQALATDAQATISLTTTSILPEIQSRVEHTPELKGLRCLGTCHTDPAHEADLWEQPAANGDSLAYIQYTSGSTASPKGVMLSHSNLLHMLAQLQKAFKTRPEDRGVSWLPLYHDMGLIGGMLLALYTGGPLTLLSPVDFVQNPLRWLQAITRYHATASGGPGFAYQLCVDRITPEERASLDLGSWRVAFCGAEPIDADVLDRFSETFAPHGFRPEAFCPAYGLAEATLSVSAKVSSTVPAVCIVKRSALEHGQVVENGDKEPGQTILSCGQVLPGQQVLIVDPESRIPCPPDHVGEIWVAGPSVGQGYWNRPEETTCTFQAFLTGSGEGPFLRTGDLGFTKDGELYIAGRLKDLIIIRGLNYDPHDIESTAQRSHTALQPNGGAAFSLSVDGEERLVIVHELRRTHRKVSAEEIARAIRRAVAEEQELPVYAVALVKPGAIPRTSSGKIQRYLCRTEFMAGRLETSVISLLENPLYEEQFRLHSAFVAPRTPVEMALAGIWAEVLNLQRISIEDNFFELGGDSLMATQVVSRLRDVFQIEWPLRGLFETPTIARLAAQVNQTLRTKPLLEIPPVAPVGRDGPLPLSFAQERMWFLHQLEPVSSAYNIPGALRLRGPLDRQALEQSLYEIVSRHEAFRTTFATADGQPIQVISPVPNLSFEAIDLRELPKPERECQAIELAQEEARRPFDLAAGPLLRVLLLQADDEEHILLFNMHHIISDAWSFGLFAGEALELYNAWASGQRIHLSALPVQYADFAIWQRQWLRDEALEALLAYWRGQLDGIQPLELPTDYPRPVMQRYRGAVRSADFPKELLDALKHLSNREGVTLFMTLLTAFNVLIHRYNGQEDIAIGVPVANRNWLEIEGVVGSFVNTLVMRTSLSNDPTVRELLHRVREVALGAYTHQDLPYAKLVAELQPERDTSHSPLVQVTFNVINVTMPPLQLKDLHATPFEVDRRGAQFDLSLTVADNDFMPEITVEYNTDLFVAATIERLLGHFLSLLEGIAADPGQRISSMPILTEAERHQLLVEWNDTAAEYPHDKCVHELLEAQADRTPEAVAVTFGDRVLTYRELDHRANQLARTLRGLGVGPEVVVGLCVERSMEMIVGLWGILKAGGAYLPLDPTYPAERLAFMLEDAQAAVVLTQYGLLNHASAGQAQTICLDRDHEQITQQLDTPPASGVSPGNLAYVIYTSGSTGKPKGVMLEHRGLVNYLTWCQQAYPLGAGRGTPVHSSISVDLTITSLLAPLLGGRTVHLLPEGPSVETLAQALREEEDFSLVKLTPAHLTLLAQQLGVLKAQGRTHAFIIGGEALLAEHIQFWLSHAPETVLVNEYGPTEAVVGCCVYQVPPDWREEGTLPIGRPISNTQLYVLDSHRQPVPVGVTGELYIGGVGVGRGYLRRPQLTAERFTADPFSSQPGARLYRTGDLVRYRPDGNLEFLGRVDDQVKLQGFRVELGEVEAVLTQHPRVREAAVAVSESRAGGRQLVAYVVPDTEAALDYPALRDYLRQRLPAYMVPVTYVTLDALPLTTSGKVDRAALPRPEPEDLRREHGYAAPRTPFEEALTLIWAEVLGLERIGVHDSFFELGGHSLLATQVVSRLRQVFQVELPLRSLFESPTIASLAAQVERRLREGVALQIPPIERVGRDGSLPLSFAQERMWFLHQLDPWNSAYNIPGALRLTGTLDQKALEQTLHEIVRRHEAFRTIFAAVDGQPVQVISPLADSFLKVIDLRALPRSERESQAMQRIQEEAQRPFDLTSGPLLRVLLLQLDADEHILFFNMHHIISDAWSLGLLTDEILKLYNSYTSEEPLQLPALPIQYADFAVWQRQWLRDEALETLLDYWKKQLDGIQPLELPTDYPRPVMQRYRGGVRSADFPRELLDALKHLSNREGVTLSMSLLAAFQLLLHRYAGQEDIAVGVPIANRNWLEIEGVVGSFVNTLALRTDLSGDPTVRDLLRRVREVALDAYAHQDMPYAKLVAELQPERNTSRAPLVQVMFNVLNVAMPPLQLKDLHAAPLEVDRQGAQFDLTLTVADNDYMPQISIEYDTDLFTAETAGRMLGHFENLLESIVSDPGQRTSSLPMLAGPERHQLLVTWNDTAADYPEKATLVELFEAQVERTPNATAFLFEGQGLSYRALNQRANQLAHYLQSLGVGPEVTVGVFLERSLDTAVCLLGILKAGGAYLPLDPVNPAERLAFMLRDAGAPVLLTRESFAGRMPQHKATVVCLDTNQALIDRQSATNAVGATTADSLAYVLYTSGSTGRPKGVLGLHRGALNRFAWMWNAFPFQAGEVCCQKTSVGFVDSVWEFFGPLLQGVPTVIIPDTMVQDPHLLIQALAEHHVTRIVLVPSLLQAILDTHSDLQARLPELRIWICSGEALPVDLVRRFREMLPRRTLLNLYGCSEVAADSTWYDTVQLGADSVTVPIGRPIANTQIYLLDSHLNPVPVGVPGEIYVGGAGLARGYINHPELTAQRFVPAPFSDDPDARLYRTGDLARYQPDGNIEYLGRRDHQVQLRGFRVEPGEIEAVLRQHPAVAQVAVIAMEKVAGAPSSSHGAALRLVAYLVTAEGIAPSMKELRSFLGSKLPTHMIPSDFVFLDALPLNPNGKIDRHALAKLSRTDSQGGTGFAAPQDETERQLVQIWEEVLGNKPVGIRDNFFELGGHSLLAVRLFVRIKQVLGLELPVASLFQAPTVEQLADTIRQAGSSPDWSVLVPIQPDGSEAPFFCVHPVGGGVLGYAELARLLGPGQPVYGLQARGLNRREEISTRLEDMAADYVEAIRRVQPRGPYYLGGYSAGGVLAFEMGRQLQAREEQVALLALFDTYAPYMPAVDKRLRHPLAWAGFLRNAPLWLRDLYQRDDGARRLLARTHLTLRATWLQLRGKTDSFTAEARALHMIGNTDDNIPEERRKLILAHLQALENYRPQAYPGRVTLFRVRGMRLFRAFDTDLGWGRLAADGVEIQMIPGAHYNILERPGVDVLAAKLKACLARAQANGSDNQLQSE